MIKKVDPRIEILESKLNHEEEVPKEAKKSKWNPIGQETTSKIVSIDTNKNDHESYSQINDVVQEETRSNTIKSELSVEYKIESNIDIQNLEKIVTLAESSKSKKTVAFKKRKTDSAQQNLKERQDD